MSCAGVVGAGVAGAAGVWPTAAQLRAFWTWARRLGLSEDQARDALEGTTAIALGRPIRHFHEPPGRGGAWTLDRRELAIVLDQLNAETLGRVRRRGEWVELGRDGKLPAPQKRPRREGHPGSRLTLDALFRLKNLVAGMSADYVNGVFDRALGRPDRSRAEIVWPADDLGVRKCIEAVKAVRRRAAKRRSPGDDRPRSAA
jgi:hypothetical protein